MARTTTSQRARAPQGAKRVAQAFLNELDTIAADKQGEVGKAAQAMVRETMIMRREKAKAAKTRTGKATPVRRKAAAQPRRKASGATRARAATPAPSATRPESDYKPESAATAEDS